MEPFVKHRGRLALLDWTDVNTDLIIPARYLKRIERTGYGPFLFADKRYEPGGAPPPENPSQHGAERPDFPLNARANHGATILVVGRNFGCGSSREHAVWAVAQAGFKAVVAPGKGEGFADIFESNALQNGLLPVELEPADWATIARAAGGPAGAEASIDLERQTLTLHDAAGQEATFSFEIPEASRQRLLQGLDLIGETLLNEEAIQRVEQQAAPWVNPNVG
ncbi:MAG TPA: 3-isopropylmalate dehydratase small subunit [Isosphaeraceae bacterium]|nr:3-isopropylmalate dehydratase small subunit [Isosphaeraceae bacterium]